MTDIETLADGEYTAVVDSVEDGFATVFFEQGGEEVGNAVLDSSALPEDAHHGDAILSVVIKDGALVETDYDPERTEERAAAVQDRFDRLSERPPDEDSS